MSDKPEEHIVVNEHSYVLATSDLTDAGSRVLKEGETFAVFAKNGDFQNIGDGAQGLYDGATRHLSRFELRLGSSRPLLLSSEINTDNSLLTLDLMNREGLQGRDAIKLRGGELHIFRSRFLFDKALYERIRFTNFAIHPIQFRTRIVFDADFKDIFEIRGTERSRHGTKETSDVKEHTVVLWYKGLDGMVRQTGLRFYPKPLFLTENEASFDLDLAPHAKTALYIRIHCGPKDPERTFNFYRASRKRDETIHHQQRHSLALSTSRVRMNEWINRSLSDLHLMLTNTELGWYPYAGIPWFNTVFGRDGIITALESLWVNSDIARAVLKYLAHTQATEEIPEIDAEPGKIVHEMRSGEMVNLGEVPFKRYYGSVDATPLFVILAGAYYIRTNDLDFLKSIWGSVKKAMDWIETYGDKDRDGFVEYERKSPTGLQNQGWKDSGDSIFHDDGSLATGPIALCEVQGYVYEAFTHAAIMASAVGENELGSQYTEKARRLQSEFDKRFWWEEAGTYYLALDGEKKPCKVIASNAGQCLFTGIVHCERVPRLERTLFDDRLFSGWGIRTAARGQARYNPMSYHNGSLWPHDNALIALGLSRFGRKESSLRIFSAFFDAVAFMDLSRLPELFCGFERRPGNAPTLYPVACSPQAWAAGALFMLWKASLGLTLDARKRRVGFINPRMLTSIDKLQIKNLSLAGASVDLLLTRHEGDDVSIKVLRQDGAIEVTLSQTTEYCH